MYELNNFDIEELKARNYLAEDGHPSIEAYRDVILSASGDFDKLAINIGEHGRDCPICGMRYKEAISERLRWLENNSH